MPDDGLLSELTILDLTTSAAGPFATKLLADYGARVIKIERPGRGDPARRVGPFPDGSNAEAGALFLYLNTGKESVTLDLETATGRMLLLELVEHADAVVESFLPGYLDSIGVGAEAMMQRSPRVVVTSVSGFGQTGPYAPWRPADITVHAAGGQLALIGDAGREPVTNAGHQAAYQAGLHAFGATLAGLYSVGVIESGQHIDIPAMEVLASTLEIYLVDYLYRKTDILAKRRGNIAGATLGVFPCADGHVGIHIMPRNFPAFARMMDGEWMLEDEKFRDQRSRLANTDELLAHVLGWSAQNTKDEIYRLAGEQRCTVAPVLSISEVLEEPHLRERGAIADVDDLCAGPLRYPGRPFRPAAGGWELRPAPRLGQHNVDVYGDVLGLSQHDIVRLRAAGVI